MRGSRDNNRRQHARTSVAYRVQLRSINPPADGESGAVRSGISRDISRGGIGVLVDYPYPTPSRLLVTFETDEGGTDRVISRIGSVVWTSPPSEENRALLGIRFSDSGAD